MRISDWSSDVCSSDLLSRGSVRPVDARKFAGVRLDMRGAGRYLLVVNTLAGEFTAPIEAKEGWSELRVPFSALVATRPGRGDAPSWRGDDLVQVGFVVQRSEGRRGGKGGVSPCRSRWA